MRTLSEKVSRFCTITVCSAIVASGCSLDRRAIISPGTLLPAQYCPGDTLTASYDFLHLAGGTCTPRAGSPDECATAAPTVTISSTPEAFPPNTLQNYSNRVDFTTDADHVDVHFAYGTGSVFVPPSTLLVNVRDHTRTAARFAGSVERLTHAGLCDGSRAPAQISGLPTVPESARLTRVCNPNVVPIQVVLSDASGAMTPPTMLARGECFSTTGPGVPAFATEATTIDIQSMRDPLARCNGGTVPDVLASPLISEVTFACP